ncbi:unnamed protein product [Mytilus edulis]|uniref:G-protein coupled receptors family 1 profile domain-containing protein n=1 Tax=Mytilus edulis TaxID=6550 RepID=A0A8S3RI03_MYTED|nr:unnamed protein product [Mytilus edulis]
MKLCMLQKPSMSISMRKTALFLAILLSILFALPLPFIYGTIKYQSTEYGISGMRCGRLKEGNGVFMILYSIGFGMYVFALVTTLIIIYSKILKTVFRNLKEHKSDTTGSKKEIEKTDENESRPNSSCKETEVSITSAKAAKQAMIPETTSDSVGQHVSKSAVANTVESALSGKRRTRNEITRKVTIMFCIITTVFVLCYIPKVTILCLEGIYDGFWENLSSSLRPAVTFLYHIFIINNIVNPLIYAFMDIEFRDNALILLKRMFNSCIK